MKFDGVGVALVSLFSKDGRLLTEQAAELAGKLAGCGVRSVTIAGTTGEPWLLGAQERAALVSACKQALPADVPVIAGTGSTQPAEAVRLTEALRDSGADALLALSPAGAADPRPYYDAVATAARDIPLLAYHFPLASEPGIAMEHLKDLPVAGLMDSSGDAERLVATLAAFGKPLYVGSSAILALAGPLGATGAILALANVAPEQCARAFDGDIAAQRDLLEVHRQSMQDFPANLKMMVAARFGTSAAVRRHGVNR
jgi:4-hydroxy-tetrahydrodipicolinate synthase